MGRNAWEAEAGMNFRSTGSTRWGRVFLGIVIVAAATFVFAYYLPLHRSHEALMRQQHESGQAARDLEQKLRDTEQQLGAAKKRTAELETERAARERSQASTNERVTEVKNAVRGKLDRYARKGGVAVDVAGSRVLAVLESKLVFQPRKPDVSPQGRAVLCDLARAARSYPLRVGVASGEGAASGAGSAWELTGLQAAKLAEALEQKCGVAKERLTATGYGPNPQGGQSPAIAKLGADKIEIEISVADAAR